MRHAALIITALLSMSFVAAECGGGLLDVHRDGGGGAAGSGGAGGMGGSMQDGGKPMTGAGGDGIAVDAAAHDAP